MLTKINVLSIIKDHILTLKNYRTGNVHYPDIILFFLIPFLISIVLVSFQILLNDGIANILITSFSIFAALLFNLLLLVYDIAGKSNSLSANKESRISLQEIYINISFCILISVVSIVILISSFFKIKYCLFLGFNICSLQWVISFAAYYFSILFVLTLLMILKRIYILLANEFGNSS